MQISKDQTNLPNPYQAPFDTLDFLLNKAAEEYQRVTVDMYGQQSANIKTYLWTANLILTGAVFILVQFKTCWQDADISIVAFGLLITALTSLGSAAFSLSALLSKFRQPIDDFEAWENWSMQLNEYFQDPQQANDDFRRELIRRYSGSIKAGHKHISTNGIKLYFANVLLTVGIGAAFISLLIFIPYLSKGGI